MFKSSVMTLGHLKIDPVFKVNGNFISVNYSKPTSEVIAIE